MAVARGSPWVVPSCEKRVSPSIKREAFSLYVFVSIVASDGHNWWIFKIATLRLRELNALLASTRRAASSHCIMKDATH